MSYPLQLDADIALRICCFAARDFRDLRKLACVNQAAFTTAVMIDGDDRLWQRLASRVDEMTLLLEGAFYETQGLPESWTRDKPLRRWEGVQFPGRKKQIDFVDNNGWMRSSRMHGPVNLGLMPRYLTSIHLVRAKLSGEIDLTHLPSGLESIHLSRNKFSGSICLEHLPRGLTLLKLDCNELSGPVSLSNLPPKLSQLNLQNNMLSGHIDFSKLPQTLENLSLSRNQFFGPLDLSQVHVVKLHRTFVLHDNDFSDVLDLSSAPSNVDVTYSGNKFSKVISKTK